MFRINHVLKKPGDIVPWGESLHWFGLTDGLLWIEAGDGVIYEYTEPHFNETDEPIINNDYQLSRFLEDFFGTFSFVAESVPDYLYNDIETIDERMEMWKALYFDLDDEKYDEFYFGVYDELYATIYQRSFDSGHLVGGPYIGCFRNGYKIKIIWKSDYKDENGKSIWTTPKGIYEMKYTDFVNEVFRFYKAFEADMDKTVEYVKNNGIPDVYVDVEMLCRENIDRKESFEQKIDMLKSKSEIETDWDKIQKIYERMTSEISDR